MQSWLYQRPFHEAFDGVHTDSALYNDRMYTLFKPNHIHTLVFVGSRESFLFSYRPGQALNMGWGGRPSMEGAGTILFHAVQFPLFRA